MELPQAWKQTHHTNKGGYTMRLKKELLHDPGFVLSTYLKTEGLLWSGRL